MTYASSNDVERLLLNTPRKALLLLLATILLAACTRKARIYNLATGEVTIAEYSYSGTGKGKLRTVATNGEKLQGEYATFAGGQMSWGSIYGAVYGPGGAASAAGGVYSATSPSTQHGTAILTGDKGTVVQCEYVTSAWNGAGAGACKDNRGTLYKLMF